MKDANYRKLNDRSFNSSTYHKKDGTEIRAILKEEAQKEIEDGMKIIKSNIIQCTRCKQICNKEQVCNCGNLNVRGK